MQARKWTRRRKAVERESKRSHKYLKVNVYVFVRKREGEGRERERERERIIKNENGRQIMHGSLLGPLQELPYTESVSSRFVKEER